MDIDRLLAVFAEEIADAVSEVYLDIGHPRPLRQTYVRRSVERMRARLLRPRTQIPPPTSQCRMPAMESRTALIARIASDRMPRATQDDPALHAAVGEASAIVLAAEAAAREMDRPPPEAEAPSIACPVCGGVLARREGAGRVILDDLHSMIVTGAWYCDTCPEVLVAVRHVERVDRHG